MGYTLHRDRTQLAVVKEGKVRAWYSDDQKQEAEDRAKQISGEVHQVKWGVELLDGVWVDKPLYTFIQEEVKIQKMEIKSSGPSVYIWHQGPPQTYDNGVWGEGSFEEPEFQFLCDLLQPNTNTTKLVDAILDMILFAGFPDACNKKRLQEWIQWLKDVKIGYHLF